MLVFSGLGLLPGQGSASSRCTQVDVWGVCVQGTQGTNYGGSWGGATSPIMGTYAASPSPTFQSTPSVIYPTTPTSTPPLVVQPLFPSGMPIPPQIAVPPQVAPGQQPPPFGLPEQPGLQPGVQISDQGGAVLSVTPLPLGRLALWALGAALAGAGVGVLIHRRRARTT